MKVLKFGGTSVGDADSIKSVKCILEKEIKVQPVVAVVSAMGGVTDKLIELSHLAESGSPIWEEEFEVLSERHRQTIRAVFDNPEAREITLIGANALLEQLRSLYYGLSLVRDLGQKTLDAIVGYGERLSSLILANLMEEAKLFDSREFIKTVALPTGKHPVDSKLTNKLVRQAFDPLPGLSIVAGFIASDRDSGEPSTLGRGGSDYTASIIAAALDAEVLEIWKDVDGFMTADPKVIKSAYTIPELSYAEALELCNFGAKVIYPPTIYPVWVKDIPIRVKNTFRPEGSGTIIKKETFDDHKPIKGISSIGDTTLVTISGLSMVGVIGTNRRIFSALADSGVSVFMVAQGSSENSSTVGVKDEDGQKAAQVLNREFKHEIESGAMSPAKVESGLATVAIVGKNMKGNPVVLGKLFAALGRSGINVISSAQGASGTNFSFVVKESELRKALNVLHDSFFLSEYQVLNLFICGVGTVGGKLLEQLRDQRGELMEHFHLKLNVVGIARSTCALFDRDGIDLREYKERLLNAEASTPQTLLQNIIGMNIYNPVFVDCTASDEVSKLYLPLLRHNVNVVTANKIAASSRYEDYKELKDTALLSGVKFLFETNVGAGLPIIGTINDLRNSGDRILKIEAVLSGTLNFIFNEISAEVPFSQAVRRAKEQGYSEPDPRIDLCGKDVLRKLVILAREAGYKVEQEDVRMELFIPDEYFAGSVEDFWARLPELDEDFERKRKILETEGKCWRFVASMDRGKCSISLREIQAGNSLYVLAGSNNIVLLTTERYKQYPMLIQGYGAGASVTAAGVFANIMSIANI